MSDRRPPGEPPLPRTVGHADWGTAPAKRWVAVARLGEEGRYLLGVPAPVGDAATLLSRLREDATPGGALVGFDFPIGLPVAYARRAGVARFLDVLPLLGTGEWAEFLRVAESAEQISTRRPFYPQRPGGTSQAHLIAGLHVTTIEDLRRRCERGGGGQKAAAPLFWTMGAQQVGKAATAGWRDVLIPGIRALGPDLAVWPFSGDLHDLLGPGRVVVAETYPAEFYHHLGVTFAPGRRGVPGGKRVQTARAATAGALLDWVRAAGVRLTPEARGQLVGGFGAGADGEDRFDAFVGLCGMLNVVLGRRPPGEPDDPTIRAVEGWMLGMAPRPPVA